MATFITAKFNKT